MSFDPEDLARDAELLQRLAHQLIPDPEAARDATQDVALAWLKKRPEGVRSSRAWFVGALRLERARWLDRKARGSVRELEPEQVRDGRLSAFDPAGRELRELIEREVRALREPYASVLYAALFEDRSLGEIAGIQGRPPATVRSQHMRGLELLRRKLDERLGGRNAWITALLPWAEPGGKAGASTVETTTSRGFGARLGWLAVSLAVSGILLWRLSSDRGLGGDRAEDLARGEAALAPTPEQRPTTSRDQTPTASLRSVPPITDSASEDSSTSVPGGSRRLRVRAVDEEGRPVADASVVYDRLTDYAQPFGNQTLAPEVVLGRTSEDGTATLDVPPECVVAGQDGRPTSDFKVRRIGYMSPAIFRVAWDRYADDPDSRSVTSMPLWKAPLEVTFLVLDERGEPLGNASVAIETESAIDVGPVNEGIIWGRAGRLLTGEGEQPAGSRFFSPGRYKIAVHTPSHGMTSKTIELEASGPCSIRYGARRILRGRVLDALARPVPGAHVWHDLNEDILPTPWSWRMTRTDNRGEYELVLGDLSDVVLWTARTNDIVGAVGNSYRIAPGITEGCDLYLDVGEPIRLRVVDGKERPLADWNLRLFARGDGSEVLLTRNTDTEGRVAFPAFSRGRLDLGVFGPGQGLVPARLWLPNYKARTGEQLLVVESAHEELSAILGRITTPGWSPAAPFDIIAGVPQSPIVQLHRLAQSGEPFAIEDLPPGQVTLTAVSAQSLAWPLGDFLLPAGSFLDLGEIVIPPSGVVRFVAEPADLIESGIISTFVNVALSTDFSPVVANLSHWPAEPIELLPGSYRVSMLDAARNRLRAEFTVRSAETTLVTMSR